MLKLSGSSATHSAAARRANKPLEPEIRHRRNPMLSQYYTRSLRCLIPLNCAFTRLRRVNGREMQAIELPRRKRREQLNGAEIFFEYHESPYGRT